MDSPYSPVDLTLTANTVYWLENNAGKGSLRAIALAGGAAVAVANNLYSTDRIAKGGDYIYWTRSGP